MLSTLLISWWRWLMSHWTDLDSEPCTAHYDSSSCLHCYPFNCFFSDFRNSSELPFCFETKQCLLYDLICESDKYEVSASVQKINLHVSGVRAFKEVSVTVSLRFVTMTRWNGYQLTRRLTSLSSLLTDHSHVCLNISLVPIGMVRFVWIFCWNTLKQMTTHTVQCYEIFKNTKPFGTDSICMQGSV